MGQIKDAIQEIEDIGKLDNIIRMCEKRKDQIMEEKFEVGDMVVITAGLLATRGPQKITDIHSEDLFGFEVDGNHWKIKRDHVAHVPKAAPVIPQNPTLTKEEPMEAEEPGQPVPSAFTPISADDDPIEDIETP
jgi:hypothetical protein